MTHYSVQSDVERVLPALAAKWRKAGVVLMPTDLDGSLISGAGDDAGDWLTRLVRKPQIMRALLRDAAQSWNTQDAPEPVEAAPGLWLCPNALIRRRERTGYVVAVMLCYELLESEQLAAMCQGASLDQMLCRSQLAALPPIAAGDVPRLAAMVSITHDDHMRFSGEQMAMQSVGQQLAESYEEMNLLYTIIQNMRVSERPERFVETACNELIETLPYRWIATQLASDESLRLPNLRGRLVVAGEPPLPIEELRMMTRQLVGMVEPDKPLVMNGASDTDDIFTELGAPLVLQPVANGNRLLGVMMAGQTSGDDQEVSSVDMKLLDAAASHMAIFLQNASLYDDLNGMFLGTLEALTSAIDAKDKYTCGHSRRVADLTRGLALEIGLDEETANRMHIAGLVHDVGKIGVPEAVLTKAGRLSDEEFEWIRQHPEIGYRILKDIPQLEDVLPGVMHHHERWDGGGYPRGLAGDEIPLVARLISLADSFDAMSSTRTYRSALERDRVLAEIRKCGGTQFDPDLVGPFTELDFAHYDHLVESHRAAEPPTLNHHAEGHAA